MDHALLTTWHSLKIISIEKDCFRIGDYDKMGYWMGYKWIPEARSADDETHPEQTVVNKLKDKRYWFGTENQPRWSPRQNEDQR